LVQQDEMKNNKFLEGIKKNLVDKKKRVADAI
jgi:hypothetical protein